MSASQISPLPRAILTWRVHLLRRDPRRLPTLLMVVGTAALCVGVMFGHPLPALAAVLLLIGAIGEYLFPITYRITEEGVTADALTSRLVLRWKETRRCLPERDGLTLSPLPTPSRLDAFRGVTLRFAPDGEPGDRASVLAALRECAPDLPLTMQPPASTLTHAETIAPEAGEL